MSGGSSSHPAKSNRLALGLVVVALLASTASAAQYVYPARGQSPHQQHRDEAHCYTWAVHQTGFDPAHPPPPGMTHPTTATGVTPGAGVAGAAGGALIGAAAGGHGGAGAAAGAIVARRVSRRHNVQQAQQAQQQQLAAFSHARAACLEGRGYTVR